MTETNWFIFWDGEGLKIAHIEEVLAKVSDKAKAREMVDNMNHLLGDTCQDCTLENVKRVIKKAAAKEEI